MVHWDNEQFGGPVPRPFWVPKDEYLNPDRKPGDPITLPIRVLTSKRFYELQEAGAIPVDYHAADWLDCIRDIDGHSYTFDV